MNLDLFAPESTPGRREPLGDQAVVLRGLALPQVPALLAALQDVVALAPFRQMHTPRGHTMSVAMTNCGHWGWTSDQHGYRYARQDPQSSQDWPPLPEVFLQLAREAAAQAGFDGFTPDACLVNRYVPSARLSLHQDRDERDFTAPIVSVSLGIPAVFLFGGALRGDRPTRVPLQHGDVVVWGGVDRLRYHGVLPLKPAQHPLLGAQRINLTFRQAG